MNLDLFKMQVLARRIAFFGLALSMAAVSFSAEESDLVENSPFLPEGWEPPRERRPEPPPPPPPERGPQPLDQIEFRGMTKFGDETSFSLFDPSADRSYWIALGQADGGIQVVEFKENEEAVVVKHDGKTRTISLHEAEVAAMEEAEPEEPRRRGRRRSREQESEAEDPEDRMRNLADEIRRRREIRRALVEEAEGNQQGNQQDNEQGGVVRPSRPNRGN